MADVKSKNLYELLGNTSDQDSDREPDVLPTKTVDKAAGRSGKRDAPKAAPTEPAAGTTPSGARRGGRGAFSDSDKQFRDRATGRNYNRAQPIEGDDGARAPRNDRDAGLGGRGRGRARGGPRRGGDRHSRTGLTEHVKQTDAAWGAPTGEGELADEAAGEVIAKTEASEGWDASKADGWDANAEAAPIPDDNWNAGDENPNSKSESAAPAGDGFGAAEAEAEPEDNSKSYADYLAEQATKKMEGLGLKEARAPNEGAKDNKKWKGAKELSKEEEEAFFQGKEEKARRERDRTRNAKERLTDFTFNIADSESGGQRGRGRGRGPRGERGEFRGRGERGERGEFRGRGRSDREGEGYRPRGEGFRGRGDRGGEFRGRGGRGRGNARDASGQPTTIAVDDTESFPSLGGPK